MTEEPDTTGTPDSGSTKRLADGAPTRPEFPARIGKYRIKRVIASGGMGTVYEAVQEQPRRHVALKVMKRGITSRSALRRFEFESQLLARLRHPNVAQVYEAGTHDDGHGGVPFFAMEYVPGAKTVTSFARERKLGTRERLDLFAKICDAVHHGHQKGIIHRDLKPGNILVDSAGEPKIIDFGVARSTDSDLAVTTLQTDVGQLIGTLQYMSPEQCEGDPTDLDTRSDVYALGVVLFELLCEQLPYDVTKVAVFEAARMVREEHPTRLSTINKTLRGDVETITLKAMEKDRERRYKSAEAFADDVRHYLNSEPIQARPPSVSYLFSRFARRNRAVVIGIAAVFLVLVGGIVGTSLAMVRAEKAEADTAHVRAEHAEADATRLAKQVEADAIARAAESEAAVFQMYVANIATADAALAGNNIATVRQRLQRAPEALRSWEWQYLSNRSNMSEATLRGHEKGVVSIAISPDSTRIASGSYDNTIKIWDAASGDEVATLHGHEASLRCVAFSPDATRVASGAQDKLIKLWDAASGEEIATLSGHEDNVMSVAFSRDGMQLASGSSDNTIKLWDVASGDEIATLHGHEKTVRSIVFSPDGTQMASGSIDTTIKLWDAETGDVIATLPGHEDYVYSVAFSPNGMRLASGSRDHTIRIWDVASGAEVETLLGHDDTIWCVAFSPDGTRVVSGSDDKTIKLWDTESAMELATLRGHDLGVWSVAFSPDGTHVVSGSYDSTIKLWNAASRDAVTTLVAQGGGAYSIAFSPDGSHLAAGLSDYTIKLWDAATGTDLTTLRGHEGGVRSVAFSPDGSRLASGSYDNSIKLWDAATGEEVATLFGHDEAIWSVAFSPDGTRLASGSADNTIKLWNAMTGDSLATLPRHMGGIRSVSFSPDGTRLISGSDDKTIKFWDAATGEEVITLAGHYELISAVAFSPDGTRIASGSHDNTIRIWDRVSATQRIKERATYHSAQSMIQPVVDRLFAELSEPSTIVEAIRSDSSLSAVQRHAAGNLILERMFRRFQRAYLETRRQRAEPPDAFPYDLNEYAWQLLTIDPADLRDPATALIIALRACEMSEYKETEIIDTLAMAYHMTGDHAKAVETQEMAIALLTPNVGRRAEYEAHLAQFLAALRAKSAEFDLTSEE